MPATRFTGVIDGLEVDIARQLAQAILGDPGKVRLKTLVTAQKVPYAADGTVDLTVSAVSMTCARWGLVDFSTEYYTAQHKLLVRSDSDIGGIQDLAGRRVCVTTGSSSVNVLKDKAPSTTIQVPLEARTDCLVALQEGTVEAYFSHDSILRGMQKQDPNTQIVGEAVAPQHYGIAIAKDHTGFVRFVNAVLERMRARRHRAWTGRDLHALVGRLGAADSAGAVPGRPVTFAPTRRDGGAAARLRARGRGLREHVQRRDPAVARRARDIPRPPPWARRPPRFLRPRATGA